MTISDTLRGWAWSFLLPELQLNPEWQKRLERYDEYQAYYSGAHRRQLKARPDQADDNIVENYIDLIVERSISLLLGDGIEFELPDETNEEYIEEVMEANKQAMTLYDAAQNAAIYGTGYMKIKPFGVESKRRENVMLPRLIVLDPRWMDIVTDPEDVGMVTAYVMRYNIGELARKEETTVFARDEMGRVLSWEISNYQSTGGKWEMVDNAIWEYEFPPIVHWKNLPLANDCYGRSDIDNVIELQDRLNFVAGNISKIIRYHAHPKTWGRGAGLGSKTSWGADEIVMVNGPDAVLQNLEMQTDLVSSQKFKQDLKAAVMEISRTVDLASMKDKVGALTNFGLRVLYNDALDKTSTKRDNMGEALLELVHRLLILDNRAGESGYIEWPDPLPVNEQESVVTDSFELDRGIVSKKTVAERRGYDWENEQEEMNEERMGEESIGTVLMRAFERGQTTPEEQ